MFVIKQTACYVSYPRPWCLLITKFRRETQSLLWSRGMLGNLSYGDCAMRCSKMAAAVGRCGRRKILQFFLMPRRFLNTGYSQQRSKLLPVVGGCAAGAIVSWYFVNRAGRSPASSLSSQVYAKQVRLSVTNYATPNMRRLICIISGDDMPLKYVHTTSVSFGLSLRHGRQHSRILVGEVGSNVNCRLPPGIALLTFVVYVDIGVRYCFEQILKKFSNDHVVNCHYEYHMILQSNWV